MEHLSQGTKFRRALLEETPLQIVGTTHVYAAMLAERAGFRAIYLSGAGVANAMHGLPDLGMTNLTDVVIEVERITQACSLPLLVDVDTGWGTPLGVKRTVRAMIQAGAAGMHVEDQRDDKRCGHRDGKQLVTSDVMCDRIKAALDARSDPDFVIMARTDAVQKEGVDAALERSQAYVDAGVDMIFAEALLSLDDYKRFTDALSVPVLANITEFGKTPLFSVSELASVGVQLILYPLSAFRAMNAAADHVYRTLRKEGTQKNVIDSMQTREELYDVLKYHDAERLLDHHDHHKKEN